MSGLSTRKSWQSRLASKVQTLSEGSNTNTQNKEKAGKFQALPAFSFKGYDQLSISKGTLKVMNTGSTLRLVPEPGVGVLSGGPLNFQYEFVEIILHFNGKSFPMELHMVHKKVHDETVEDAPLHESGLCVLGFMFDIVESDMPIHGLNKLARIADYLCQTGTIFDKAKLKDLFQDGLVLDLDVNIANFVPSHLEEYFTYKGSFTTGGYEEAVKWVVFRNPLAIKKEHLKVFQTLLQNSGQESIMNNLSIFDRPFHCHREELSAREVIKAVGVSTKNNSGKVGGTIPKSIQAVNERGRAKKNLSNDLTVFLTKFRRRVGKKTVEPPPVIGVGNTRVEVVSEEESVHKEAREG